MIKTIHIHSDPKFLIETKRYNENIFQNTIIFIGDDKSVNPSDYFKILTLSKHQTDIKKIIAICSDADLVVLYELDMVKSYIASKIPKKIIIVWRFFGAELYNKNILRYLSKSSKKCFNSKKFLISEFLKYRTFFLKIKSRIKNREFPNYYFAKAIRRVDLFLCLTEYEYIRLKQRWKNLPQFIQIPYNLEIPRQISKAKQNLIIIGNSRSIYNNHIDIIELIEYTNFKTHFHFILPFSYGIENCYTQEIRRLVKSSQKHLELLEDFIPFKSYSNLISKAKAAVFNSYRQMAMGNIFELIISGTKIYLNSKNIIYDWLKDLSFKIFTIEDFVSDLESDNLELDTEDKERNIITLNNMQLKFSEDKFISDLSKAIGSKTGNPVSN